MFRKISSWLAPTVAVALVALAVSARPTAVPAQGASAMAPGHSHATIHVTLVDPVRKARDRAATVSVTVRGITLIDPATVHERPHAGQGHLHYRVDDGFIIATTAKKLSFHELSSGPHKFTVMLAANDHTPLGPEDTASVTVP